MTPKYTAQANEVLSQDSDRTMEVYRQFARQAGAVLHTSCVYPDVVSFNHEALASFVLLIRQQAFEEAAKVVEHELYPEPYNTYRKNYNECVTWRANKIRSLK